MSSWTVKRIERRTLQPERADPGGALGSEEDAGVAVPPLIDVADEIRWRDPKGLHRVEPVFTRGLAVLDAVTGVAPGRLLLRFGEGRECRRSRCRRCRESRSMTRAVESFHPLRQRGPAPQRVAAVGSIALKGVWYGWLRLPVNPWIDPSCNSLIAPSFSFG